MYLQSLEQGAGRERLIHWGPRTLDLDIILAFDEAGSMISICAESSNYTASLFLG